jgi:ribosomal protein L11 methylase PrmA
VVKRRKLQRILQMTLPVMIKALRDPGSFRDPAGSVWRTEEGIFRTLNTQAAKEFLEVRDSGVLDSLIREGLIVKTQEVSLDSLGQLDNLPAMVLQHEVVPFFSYPYEWSFSLHKRAALFHLDLHLRLLEHNLTLSDATAYNVQFNGVKPYFVDVLSLKPYHEGSYWQAHQQFIEQFLNPLLFQDLFGISPNSWFRGELNGIPMEVIVKMASFRSYFNWRFLLHIILPNYFQKKAESNHEKTVKTINKSRLSKSAFCAILQQLRNWINSLESYNKKTTVWNSYDKTHTYKDKEYELKQRFVISFSQRFQPKLLVDIGCNSGDFSELALQHGVQYVVGLDADHAVLDRAFQRASKKGLSFLPLFQDAANPSPSQGWNQMERKGLLERVNADALIALAFVHHLAIARNIPLEEVVSWLVSLAPVGVVEFVPKSDPTVITMLSLREDLFPNYTKEVFEDILRQHVQILQSEVIAQSGRTLYMYAVNHPSGIS